MRNLEDQAIINFVTDSTFNGKNVNSLFFNALSFPLLDKKIISTRVFFKTSYDWMFDVIDKIENEIGNVSILRNIDGTFSFECYTKDRIKIKYQSSSRKDAIFYGILKTINFNIKNKKK